MAEYSVEPKELPAENRRIYSGFTKAITWVTIILAIVLALMAMFLT